MRVKATAWVLSVALATGCSGGEAAREESAPAADSLTALTVNAASAMAALEPLRLGEDDVEHFVAALEDFKRAGLESRLGSDASEARQFAEGLRASSEAMAILQRHGFDLARFQRVGYSVALALAAADAAASAPKVNEALAEVEKLKGQVPKEQYDAMVAGAKAAAGIAEDMQNQPEGNVELVKRFRDRIERIGKDE